MKKLLVRLVPYLLLVGLMILLNYLFLPALTIHSPGFRLFIGIFFIGVLFIELIMDVEISGYKKVSQAKYTLIALPIAFVLIAFVIQFFNGPIFRSRDYANLIEVKERDFETDFYAMSTDQIPMMDRDTAERLGDRRIGSMSELVSQFVPANAYTQINIENEPYRVTPLEYSGFMQWLNNRKEGIPNYLKVDMVSGEVTIEDLDENIKYSHSERFSRDVQRHLRKHYPTTMFRSPSFEVDDEGRPYYVATTYENKFLFAQQEPSGVIILDAFTGETEAYELGEMPTWMDRIYSAELILEQLNYYGKYTNGFWNSVFQKRGVTQTTEGYNYIPMNDDVFLYTGVTSVNSDASNIGFYLVNLRTKEAEFYPVTSADEFSAMASAEGSLQQMRYTSTFPLLLNLNDRPYYISSLKDDSGLVRAYALVDAQDYQKVLTSDTVDGLIAQLGGASGGVNEPIDIEEIETVDELTVISGHVENISQAVVAGDTIYYFMIDGSIYKASITLSDQLPFVDLETELTGEVNQDNVFRSITIIE